MSLPLYGPDGKRLPGKMYEQVAAELTDRFGGLTAYARAPAEGLWEERPGQTQRDDIVIYEVMVEKPEPAWWTRYRRELERRFQQEELVVRAHEIFRY